MIKLKIKRQTESGFPFIEIIDFDGDFENGFLKIQTPEGYTISYRPDFLFDGWVPIEKLIEN